MEYKICHNYWPTDLNLYIYLYIDGSCYDGIIRKVYDVLYVLYLILF